MGILSWLAIDSIDSRCTIFTPMSTVSISIFLRTASETNEDCSLSLFAGTELEALDRGQLLE